MKTAFAILLFLWLAVSAFGQGAQTNSQGFYGGTISGGTSVFSNITFFPNNGTNPTIQFQGRTQDIPASSVTNGVSAGGIWYGGPTNPHTFFAQTYKVARSIALAQDIVLSDTVVSNTVTATTNTRIYKIDMAANYLSVGKYIEPILQGLIWQNNNPGSFPVMQVWLNATNLLLTVPGLPSTLATAGPWQARFEFTCRAIGNSGSLRARGEWRQSPSSGGIAISTMDGLAAPLSFDSTINNTISITVSNNVGGPGPVSVILTQGRTLCLDSVPGQ